MVMYSISSKLSSASSMINKATAAKITSKLVGKNARFHFCMNKLIRTHVCAANHVCEILNIFVLLDKFFCLILNANLFGFLDFCIFNLWRPRGLFSVFAFLKYIYFESYSTTTELLRIELNWC